MLKQTTLILVIIATSSSCLAFTSILATQKVTTHSSPSSLFGLFDKWGAAGSGKDRLDEEWEKQQEILKFRRSSTETKTKYFEDVRGLTCVVFLPCLSTLFVLPRHRPFYAECCT